MFQLTTLQTALVNDLTWEFTGGQDDVRALLTACSISGGLDAIRSIGAAPGHGAGHHGMDSSATWRAGGTCRSPSAR